MKIRKLIHHLHKLDALRAIFHFNYISKTIVNSSWRQKGSIKATQEESNIFKGCYNPNRVNEAFFLYIHVTILVLFNKIHYCSSARNRKYVQLFTPSSLQSVIL